MHQIRSDADVADVIERRFESHIINAQPDRTRYRSLTDTQLQIIRTLIRPGTTETPFPERLHRCSELRLRGIEDSIDLRNHLHRCVFDRSFITA